MSKLTRYSIWSRYFRTPKAKDGESTFDAVNRIAKAFVGREVWRATTRSVERVVVALRDMPVRLVGIRSIDLHGKEVKNGSIGTYYPNVTFSVHTTDANGNEYVGISYRADELYETREQLAKDSVLMCDGYSNAFRNALSSIRYHALSLQASLQSYRNIAAEYAGRGWATKRIWEDGRVDAMIARLMPIADDAEIAEVCK